MAQKILALVSFCGECPNYGYHSGNRSSCKLTDEIVDNKNRIASFCPLSDFPSRLLADMDMTIRTLRKPNEYGIIFPIMSHIATKLKVNLGADCVIKISVKSGESIYLRHDYITEIEPHPSYTVHFVYGEKKYKLHPDGKSPTLYEAVRREGIKEELWCELHIE